MVSLADLLPLALLQRPLAGPAFNSWLPKSPTNVTAGSPPAPQVPQADWARLMSAFTGMAQAGPENEYKKAQAEQALAIAGLARAAQEPAPPMFGAGGGVEPGSMFPAPGALAAPLATPTSPGGGMQSALDFSNLRLSAPVRDMGGGLVSALGPAVEKVESGGNPNAVSKAGAIGLRQIMPGTGAQYGVQNPRDLFNPTLNRQVGDTILGDLLQRYGGDLDAALIGYNAGPGRADKWLASGRDWSVLPKETQNYVPKVKQALAEMTQGQAQPSASERSPFPPGQRFNSRGEPISEDLFRTLLGQRSGPNIPPEVIRGFAQANAAPRPPAPVGFAAPDDPSGAWFPQSTAQPASSGATTGANPGLSPEGRAIAAEMLRRQHGIPQANAAPGALAPPMQLAQAGPPAAQPPQMPAPGAPLQSGMPRISQQYLEWAQRQDRINAALGRRNPVAVEEALKMAPGMSGSPEYAEERSRREALGKVGPAYLMPEANARLQEQIAEMKARAEARAAWGRPEYSPQLQGELAGARAGAEQPHALRRQENEATLTRETERQRQERSASLEMTTLIVGGREITMTREQAAKALKGLGVPELGIPPLSGAQPSPQQGQSTLQPGGPLQFGKRHLSAGQIKAEEAAATDAAATVKTYRDAADMAASTKSTLQTIAGEIGGHVHGPFAPMVQQVGTYMRMLDPSWNRQVQSYEELFSASNELVRKAVRQSDPNPSFVQIRMALDSLPVPERSPEGLQKITNRMIGIQDHDIARAAAIAHYRDQSGGIEGFDSWWRKSVSPYAFVFAKMTDDDRLYLVSKLNSTKQGQQEKARLLEQLQFIKQMGLDQ